MTSAYILALDQGTTSSRSILFDHNGKVVGISQKEFTQIFPQPGWVEHNASEILETQRFTIDEVIRKAGITYSDISAIGITNQRETTVVWEIESGKPVYNAIVWQDRRTASLCEDLKQQGHEKTFRDKTGLVLDAYFSGTKLKWILDNVEGARQKAEAGKLLFGTIDSWLTWNLTNGKSHVTDPSNASRTLLFNIHEGNWDPELINILGIPEKMLPVVKECADEFGIAEFGSSKIAIRGMAGDQQAALFGQACFDSGMAKNTYGTGCFMLMNTGSRPVTSRSGLISTVAWKLNGITTYASEGSIFIAGAALQWLRDGLGIIENAGDSESIALSVSDSGNVYFVPAFAGLGAPWWDMYARGAIFGLTRGTTKAHLTRAALEAIAYQTLDVISAMENDSGIRLKELRVDGGATANNFLMQFQADMLGVPVERPVSTESTAWGAASLAGIQSGIWDLSALRNLRHSDRIFNPEMQKEKRDALYNGWNEAVQRTLIREK